MALDPGSAFGITLRCCLRVSIIARPLQNGTFNGARHLHARTSRLRITACIVSTLGFDWTLAGTAAS